MRLPRIIAPVFLLLSSILPCAAQDIGSFGTLTGAGVVASTDKIAIWDASAPSPKTRGITLAELVNVSSFTNGNFLAANSVEFPQVNGLQPALDAKAPIASPTFTGTVSGITKAMVGLSNADNTSDLNKPVSIATQTALQAKPAIDHSRGAATAVATWLARDQFSGTPGSYGIGGTITSDISGTITTYSNNLSATFQKAASALLMRSPSGWCGLKSGAAITHTAGRTGIAVVKLIDAKNDMIRVGWGSSSFLSGGYDTCYSGVTLCGVGGGETNTVKLLSAGANVSGIGFRDLQDGDTVAIAVTLTASGFDVFMNGGSVAKWGATTNGAGWIKLYSNTSGTIAGNLNFVVESRSGQTAVLEMGTTDTFTPDTRAVMTLESDNSNVLTHCANTLYDSNGNLWATWSLGNGADAAADISVIVRCRLPDGRWSAKTVVAGPGSGATRYDAGTLWLAEDGTVRVIYNQTTDAWATVGQLRSKTLSVSNAAVITQGSATAFSGVSSAYGIVYQRVLTITAGAYVGRIIIPLNDELQWWSLYSDNNGATWTEGTKYYGLDTGSAHGYEPAVVEEGPSKTLVAYVRTSAGTSANMPRWVSANGGATWTMSGTIPVPNCDSRAQAVRLANGNVALIGNDSTTNYVRKDPTLWILTSGGALIGKNLLAGGWDDGWNYPALDVRGDMLAVVMPMKDAICGRVFFAEQTVAQWTVSTADREVSKLFSRGLAGAGINTDITRAMAVREMGGFLHTDNTRAAIYTVGNGNLFGYGFDPNGLKMYGGVGGNATSWAIGTDGRWAGAKGINLGGSIQAVIPPYADDTAAGVGGLTTGQFYQVTGTGVLKVKQ